MRTRSRSRSRNNSPQREASPAIVEPLRIKLLFLEDQFQEDPPPESPMADNRTMAELFQAPTEGYEDAIVIPEITANNFELKHGHCIDSMWILFEGLNIGGIEDDEKKKWLRLYWSNGTMSCSWERDEQKVGGVGSLKGKISVRSLHRFVIKEEYGGLVPKEKPGHFKGPDRAFFALLIGHSESDPISSSHLSSPQYQVQEKNILIR
nr:reverse transcriptase domain-containing protein [Tanacetum cinerariifolium]